MSFGFNLKFELEFLVCFFSLIFKFGRVGTLVEIIEIGFEFAY